MIRLLADENFNDLIVEGLFLREPDLDLVRVKEVGLVAAKDPAILAWAAEQDRIVLTHDFSTVTKYAYDRVRVGWEMPGVIEVPEEIAIGRAIEEILVLVVLGLPQDFENQVWYVRAGL